MMKFVILREAVIEGKPKKKVLVEWDQQQIEDALVKELLKQVPKNVAAEPPPTFIRNAFKKIIEDFKKETIKIP